MTRIRGKIFACVFFLLFQFLATGCNKAKTPETIRDLAFDVNPKSGYSICVMENSEWVDYLVLSADYSGKALLLRKDLLGTGKPLDDEKSYYQDSSIDCFLNSEFYFTLSDKVQSIIAEVPLIITAPESILVAGTATKTIQRKIFLLSFSEVGYSNQTMAALEGMPLQYFTDNSRRIAYSEGVAGSWWLRTPYLNYENTSWWVGIDGSRGEGNSFIPNGVRPAFCVDSSLEVSKGQSSEGTEFYYLSVEQ